MGGSHLQQSTIVLSIYKSCKEFFLPETTNDMSCMDDLKLSHFQS